MTPISQHPFSFGVEEEFFFAHPRSRMAVSHAPRGLMRALKQRFGERVGTELLQSQVETSTPVCLTERQARDSLVELRRGLIEMAADHGVHVFAAGTHPLGDWREHQPTDGPRYERMIDDFQIIGRRNLLCGLHVHVQPPDGADRIEVINRLMPWLPIFLALSTSSPFWHRQRSGLMSYRQAAYDEWPRTGIPDFFIDEADYHAYIATLVHSGSIKNSSFVWWAIRPSLRYPTVELRIADSCTDLDDAITLALLFRCLVRAASRGERIDLPAVGTTRLLIEENRWRCKRYGCDDGFFDYARRETVPFGDALDDLLARIAPDAVALGHVDLATRVKAIPARGTSAHGQLEVYARLRAQGASRAKALKAVVDWLVRRTHPGNGDSPAPAGANAQELR